MRGNNIDFENLPDAEKFNFIQDAAQKLPVDEKAKLVTSLLSNEEFQVIARPSQLNATNIFNTNINQISLMDKADMGVLLEAIAEKLKNS